MRFQSVGRNLKMIQVYGLADVSSHRSRVPQIVDTMCVTRLFVVKFSNCGCGGGSRRRWLSPEYTTRPSCLRNQSLCLCGIFDTRKRLSTVHVCSTRSRVCLCEYIHVLEDDGDAPLISDHIIEARR